MSKYKKQCENAVIVEDIFRQGWKKMKTMRIEVCQSKNVSECRAHKLIHLLVQAGRLKLLRVNKRVVFVKSIE